MTDASNNSQNALDDEPGQFHAHPAWKRLEDQLQWYDNKSAQCHRWYKWTRLTQICLAVSVPVLSHLDPIYAKWLTAIAGGLIAVLEGVQHLHQYSLLWITYRTTAERLKSEKYLFLSGAGRYRDQSSAQKLIILSERVEELVSTEHASWLRETSRLVATREREITRS